MASSIFLKAFLMSLSSITLGLFSSAETSFAIMLQSNFSVNIVDGPLAGNTYTGDLSFDNSSLLGIGDERLTPSPANGNLKLRFSFTTAESQPKIYTGLEDNYFPDFPRANFQDGIFLGIDYNSRFSTISQAPVLDFNLDDFTYSPTGFIGYSGVISYGTPVPVPFDYNHEIILLPIIVTIFGIREIQRKK